MKKDYTFLDHLARGQYFYKKSYSDEELLSFDAIKTNIPNPIISGRPDLVECYWYTVKILFQNTHIPSKESGFVSNFVDAAFNKDIFLWDTAFMTLFCNLFHCYIPGIRSLDNFYCKQFDDGEVPREMVRETGKDFLLWVNAYDKPLYSYFHNHYGFREIGQNRDLDYETLYKPDLGRKVEKNPYLTLDNLNHPILAMAEWESYCFTGDTERLFQVLPPLFQYYMAFKYHVRHENGLYVTDWASMDNSPRNKHLCFAIDTSCEMVLFANNLIDIIKTLHDHHYEVQDYIESIQFLEADKVRTAEAIQKMMWHEKDGFFYDLTSDCEQIGIKTAAAFWAIISGVASYEQCERLKGWLNDKQTFNRPHRVPVLAANEAGYNPQGGYWSGSVWAPMNAMIVMGLEKSGHQDVAREIAVNHLESVSKVFSETGTIWENYSADFISSGDSDHRDMVGWSGLAPILYLIQYGIGLHYDQQKEKLVWKIDATMIGSGKIGVENYWFQGITAHFLAQKQEQGIKIDINTNREFELEIFYKSHKQVLTIHEAETLILLDE